MKRSSTAAVVLALALPAWAQEMMPPPQIPPPCFSAHKAGSGDRRISICISEDGNIVEFESPRGHQYMGMGEGYALCSMKGTVVHGYDAHYAESGFGPPTVTQPNGPNTFPLTISRPTLDGVFVLTQEFSWNTAQRDVTINMTVANVSLVDVKAVRLIRYFHHYVPLKEDPTKYGMSRTCDSVLALGDGVNRHGLCLAAATLKRDHSTAVESFLDWTTTTAAGCNEMEQVTPMVGTGTDLVGRVKYHVGTVKAGKDKSVAVVYTRL